MDTAELVAALKEALRFEHYCFCDLCRKRKKELDVKIQGILDELELQ